MTQDEIIRMARESGGAMFNTVFVINAQDLERFANLVAEATKEKAAKVCENVICYHKGVAKLCAAAIRSMKL